VKITIDLDVETVRQLQELATSAAMLDPGGGRPTTGQQTIAKIVRYLVASAADGVRRPGSWERGWVEQAFGEWGWAGE
jgi:hypothetical protein